MIEQPVSSEHYYDPKAILAEYRALADAHQGTDAGERFQRLARGLEADHATPALPMSRQETDAIRAGIAANHAEIKRMQRLNIEANTRLQVNAEISASMRPIPNAKKRANKKAKSNG
jgi:hypothetical protein